MATTAKDLSPIVICEIFVVIITEYISKHFLSSEKKYIVANCL